MPILNATFWSIPMAAEMSGTRRQNFSIVDGLTEARVSAAMGPETGAVPAWNGVLPDHVPRADVGFRKIVYTSSDRRAQRRYTGAFATRSCAVFRSGQVARIAQTAQFGFGVNPCPVPDPHSL